MRTTIELDVTEIIAELTAMSDRYERALADNDLIELDALFHDGPEVVRYGATECLYGADEIAAFRRARTAGAPARETVRREVVAIGRDAGCVHIEFRRASDGRLGRQSQTWWRGPRGWCVISAHVSLLGA